MEVNMKKKTFTFVSALVGGVATIASATVTFLQPQYAPAIVGAIGIISTATIDVMSLFIKGGE